LTISSSSLSAFAGWGKTQKTPTIVQRQQAIWFKILTFQNKITI